MFLRRYHTSDCKHLAELFYQTVHNVNTKDYTKEQLDVWATGNVNLDEWNFFDQLCNGKTKKFAEAGVAIIQLFSGE